MGDEFKESRFNEAALKMERINRSQSIINSLRAILFEWNREYGKWNYEVVSPELISLLKEVKSKQPKDEKVKSSRLRNILFHMLEEFPVYSYSVSISLAGKEKKKFVNSKNKEEIRKIIYICEDYINDEMESHGMSSPNVDDDEGL